MNDLNHSRRLAARLCAIPLLLAGAVSALADARYVDVNSTNATPPYTNWTTAATNIQDAVDAAVAGDEIVVTNGIYATGGRDGNRVEVDKLLSLRSINGPQVTAISGGRAVRCVYMTNEVRLSGFTLINGFSHSLPGGGVYGGILDNCTLTSNSVGSSIQLGGNLYLVGGGAIYSTLNNCTLNGNWVGATNTSQAATTQAHGGGAYQCMLNNCTVSGNSAIAIGSGASQFGGGTWGCNLSNCISFGNYVVGSSGRHCVDCYSPGVLGDGGNWFGDPLFVDQASGDLRLQSNSPCINAGNNAFAPAGPDLDGNPRIAGGTVDIGAYEFQSPASMISYAWLQQFNLPINSATDTADPDGDGVDNYHEWLAGTDPTNPLSFPPLLTLIPYGANVILTWPTNAVGFTLQSTTKLGSRAVWDTNSPRPVVIGGQNVIINPISGPQQFYRLSQ